jgi:hypothetical protein
VKGYLTSASAFLVPQEIELLAFSGKLITFESGLRFLTDYLLGDTYFKTHREGQKVAKVIRGISTPSTRRGSSFGSLAAATANPSSNLPGTNKAPLAA